MYGIQGRSWIALGDPVGEPREYRELIWQFSELADTYDGWPVFYRVDSSSLDLYIDVGMTFMKFGEEGRVPLKDFSLEGPSYRKLRSAHRRIAQANYVFSVVPSTEVPSMLDKFKIISDVWLASKHTAEKKFSLGFFQSQYLMRLPAAVVQKEDKIVAFATIWIGAHKKELSIDLMRYLPDSPNGIMDYLFAELMLWGRQGGYEWFNLGTAPLSGLEQEALAPLWPKVGTFVFRHGEHFYNFQGLRQYKEKFQPQWQPEYIACHKGLMLPRILIDLAKIISGGVKGNETK